MTNYTSIVTVRPPRDAIDVAALFDTAYMESDISPVDQFLKNSVLLNQHWIRLGNGQEVSPEMSRLLLVGYVSAVEGYMRSLIRKLILTDEFTRVECGARPIPFSAVLHHDKESLPDALLEEQSFSTDGIILSALKTFVGISNLSTGTRKLLSDFASILQLRHCCAHRFGKLGLKNATVLGLHMYATHLEKPVVLNKAAIGTVADLTFTLVKSINNDVFGFVIQRSATSTLPSNSAPGIGWTWNKQKDKSKFAKYYKIFASTLDATPSAPANDLYESFRTAYRQVGQRRRTAQE